MPTRPCPGDNPKLNLYRRPYLLLLTVEPQVVVPPVPVEAGFGQAGHLAIRGHDEQADAVVAADAFQLPLLFDIEGIVGILGEGQPSLVGRVLLDLLDDAQRAMAEVVAGQPGVGAAAEQEHQAGDDELPEAVVPLVEEEKGAAEYGDEQAGADDVEGEQLLVQLGVDRRQGLVRLGLQGDDVHTPKPVAEGQQAVGALAAVFLLGAHLRLCEDAAAARLALVLLLQVLNGYCLDGTFS